MMWINESQTLRKRMQSPERDSRKLNFVREKSVTEHEKKCGLYVSGTRIIDYS